MIFVLTVAQILTLIYQISPPVTLHHETNFDAILILTLALTLALI